MKELFLNNLPETIRDQIEDADTDTFKKVIEKSLAYIERHKELKLRTTDIQLESTFRADVKTNNLNLANKGNEEAEKGKNNLKGNKKENQSNQVKNQQKPNNNEPVNLNNIDYTNNTNQRENMGNVKRNIRGRYNQCSSFRNQYRGGPNFRGNGNSFRGQQGNFRGRQFVNGSSGHYRGNELYFNRGSYNFLSREPKCFSCGQMGHFRRSCDSRDQNQEDRNNTTNHTKDTAVDYCLT